VADNDVISGPKLSKSRQYIARLPSLEEMIAQTEQDSEQRVLETESLIKTGQELARRLKQAVRKMESESRQSPKADWQQQKELESIAEKNLELLDKVEGLAERMESSLEQMRERSLMSREIMEKLAEIQKLFEEVATPEMREAQRELMEALQNMDRQQLEEALKDFEMSQEELLERMERTLALLKRMQVEQKMEAMIREAEQLIEDQEQMNELTESTKADQLPQYSESEDQIKESLGKLKQEVPKLKDLLKEAGMEESQEAQKFAEAVESTDADRNMAQMSSSMQKLQKGEALEEGEQALSKLFDMLSEMQEQQMAMKGGDSDKIKEAMRRAIDDANYLSKDQEKLYERTADIGPRSIVIRDLAIVQQDLRSACSGLEKSIAELSTASPFIAAELNMLMDRAERSMETAVEQLDIKRGPLALQEQREAMVTLNKVSLRLMESLDRQNQCDNAKNCDQGLAKLESLCNKQSQLNMSTRKQCNNPSLSPEAKQRMRASLGRLAGEQSTIRKSLEELDREFGNSRQIMGRLDGIVSEMRKVEEELTGGEVGRQTTERQLQIYSRMLEATRSLQRKDFSERRQATTATEDVYQVPPALSSEVLNDQTEIEDLLRQFLDDEYPAQYEEQVKAYFRALLQLRYQAQPRDQGE
jgi:hypothetical protein